MKPIQQVIQKTLLCAALALMASGTARATWYEQPVAGVAEVVYSDMGAVDTNWNIYYCMSNSGKLYAIYNPGPGANWTGSPLATNCATNFNQIACDPVNHWTFYTGNNGHIWVIYWTGGGWASAEVGSNANFGRQLCVDSVYHCLWYLDGIGFLWLLYFNGTAWVETQIDGTDPRSRINSRVCGVDSIWHIAWYLTSDRKSVRGTYWNGAGWTNGTPVGTLPGAEVYFSLCCQESTHTPFTWQENGSSASTKGGYFYWSGSAWTPATCFQDGNLPTTPGFCVVSPNPYSYLFTGFPGCYFTGWNAYARNWTSCRLDNATMSGGLSPLACGQNGRAILCRPIFSGTGVRMLFSDVP